jgi:GntR family transcriptional regulator
MEEPGIQAYKPLYVHVKEQLTRRLIDGVWQPGQLIPSEIELAREMGVSQGTVRKALDAMTAENLFVRRQGRGTFVAIPEDRRVLFQFFHLFPDTGEREFPDSTLVEREAGIAGPDAAAALGIGPGDPVHRFERVRALGGQPLLAETVTLPAARFPGFEALEAVPNNVYRLYSERWGITIARAAETLKAVAAAPGDAARLGVAAGVPLLAIRRVAFDL